MASSGFTTRKQEHQYDETLFLAFELLSFKVMELVKVCDHALIDMDESPVSTHKHLRWISKFFDVFRVIYKMEKHRYQDPKFFDLFLPLVKFLRDRQKKVMTKRIVMSREITRETSMDSMSEPPIMIQTKQP